jgi:hypothetical protein
MRDPLVATYKAIHDAIKTVHGTAFTVRDEQPDPTEFTIGQTKTVKEILPAANISYVSGTSEKALMREHEPHGILNNFDGTFTVGTEALRFDYMIQVSFYAERQGTALRLATEFMAYIESENEIPIPEDKWETSMQVFTEGPPVPPRGEKGLYQSDLTLSCRGKLITEEVVSAIDVSNFKPKINRE